MMNSTTSTDSYVEYTQYDYDNYDEDDHDDANAAPCSLKETWAFLGRFAPIAYILVFILALVGNVLVLCVIRRYRQSRHSPCSFSLTDTFLLHLAVSDLLLAVTLPFFAVEWINEWVFGVFMCKITGAVFSLNVYCGVLFLACISFDRYLAITLLSLLSSLLKSLPFCCSLSGLISVYIAAILDSVVKPCIGKLLIFVCLPTHVTHV